MNSRLVSRLIVSLIVCLGLLAASCTDLRQDAVTAAQGTVDAIASVRPSGIPDHFRPEEPAHIARAPGDWDVASYFDVLEHLSVEPGYVIDYFYIFDGGGGRPFIYARPADEAPYQSLDDYLVAQDGALPTDDSGEHSRDFLDHVVIDGTREGYFQFASLSIMASQFYLYWHAGYNDTTIVCDEDSLERVMSDAATAFEGDNLPKSVVDGARELDLQPTVQFVDDSTALVRLVTFSKWGGFAEVEFTIARALPHSIMDVQATTLIEYDCGVSF